MVEGPGCTLNGEKIRARVRPGQAVTDVRGRELQGLGGSGSSPAASGPVGSSQGKYVTVLELNHLSVEKSYSLLKSSSSLCTHG
ncbi:NEIL3 [Cervus elaphus hippelaphus]|uniref:NEIL3 n=1 Tax=Cervus elaphus hippelaphus TaxID=46360 RepID=A0A212C2T4_CEREH|nr:NEIL3 [Cervus elaphus hippelaphus]